MYVVVGCGECSALWVIRTGTETAECPRCGKRHQTERLRRFVETDDEDAAREARASMLAARGGQSEAFAEVDSVAELDDQIEDAGVGDAEYLERSGLDADAVAAAGERATEGAGGSSSREELVREAVRDCDPATEAAVVERAAGDGVPAAAARDLLERLVRAGEATERGGEYRLL
jgi:hypothetical protein